MILAVLGYALLALCVVAQLLTVALAVLRVRRRVRRKRVAHAPLVSLVRPVCGVENYIGEMLESGFRLTYPNLELLFCVDDEADPIVPVVRSLIAKYPEAGARLLVGRDRMSGNPKLNNMWKGYRAASADWIIFSDSNALLPPDYVEQLFDRWGRGVGVVSHATIAVRPGSVAAELECAFMNSGQARWALAGDSLGRGYALGKTLMWSREALAAAGGFEAMGLEAAEDIASTRALRRAGLRARLALRPLPQAVGSRRFRDVWRRQLRWAQLRRSGLPGVYLAEPLGFGLVALGVALLLAGFGAASWLLPGVTAILWYGSEVVLLALAGWPLSARMPLLMVVRDVLMPLIWLSGWTGRQFDWRGTTISLSPERKADGSAARD